MKALLIAAAAIAASLLGFAQSTASAAPPVAVSIQLHPTTFFPVELGTWEASGAINDSGTYERTFARATGSVPDCFCPPEHTGTFKEEFLLTGAHGTLTIKAEEQQTPSEEEFGTVTGVWQVVTGTGSYDRVSGHGTDVFGPPLTLYLTGVISKADD
jgi:hypothetical protein